MKYKDLKREEELKGKVGHHGLIDIYTEDFGPLFCFNDIMYYRKSIKSSYFYNIELLF
jgi:hypothetical protein